MTCIECNPGRRFIGRLPHGEDLITAIEAICNDNVIQMATFSVIGAVSTVTYGYYDQVQQVYVTQKEVKPFEIASCMGNISLKDRKPFVHAHAVLSDESGSTIAGHLFSETILFAGEIIIQELEGPVLERSHDEKTGLMLWPLRQGD